MEPADRIPITRASTARRRRALEERIFLRFPALGRRLLAGWARLPRGSRLRRALLARFFPTGYAAVNRRDFDVMPLGLDPAIDYRAVFQVFTLRRGLGLKQEDFAERAEALRAAGLP